MGRFTLRDEGVEALRSLLSVYSVWLIVFSKSVFCRDLCPLHTLPLRKNYRHRQSAEAGAREGLTAANGGMHGVLSLVSGGGTLPEPTPTAAFSLNTTAEEEKGETGRRGDERRITIATDEENRTESSFFKIKK